MQDGAALVETLFEADILREDSADAVRTTSEFEKTRAIYHDTYGHASDEEFRESVADAFDVSPDEAQARIDEGDVTRASFVAYLSVSSHLEADVSRQELAAMAEVVTELSAGSPVPDELIEVTDDSAVSFHAEHPDSVVVVFKHHCDPCDSQKEHLDELRAATPDNVTWAGVDGETATSYCSDHDVEAAPTTLCFRDGELVESKRGWVGPDRLIETLDEIYGE